MDTRLAALKCLLDILEKKKPYEDTTDFYCKKVDSSASLINLTAGAIKNKISLDYFINNVSSRKKLSPPVRNILRLAVYELTYLEKPKYAVINSYVEISKKYEKQSTSFVNAVLRNYCNKINDIRMPLIEENPSNAVSIIYSHPEWLVERWINNYGPSATLGICEYNNTPPKITLRINTLKIKKEALTEILKSNNIEFSESIICSDCINLTASQKITEIPGYNEGYWIVQGESSSLVAKVLDPQQNESILDLCAAPGSKTTHIAALLKNTGTVTAIDISEKRIAKIKENIARLGINNVKLIVGNASKFKSEELFDKVLIDAPCSNTGVFQKRPDARWNRTQEDIVKLSNLQLSILENASKLVKNGGVIVYSTCSIEPEENTEVISKFLAQNPEFSTDDTSNYIEFIKDNSIQNIQIIQSNVNTDGFFITRLKKTSSK